MTISVPETLRKEIADEVKAGGYTSVSEFFRAVLRERQEYAILRDVTESRHESQSGHAKTLRSLKDLR
ncbi:MAG: ribbon-helix-helix domain-containing protein [Minisyncoccota bacterium]